MRCDPKRHATTLATCTAAAVALVMTTSAAMSQSLLFGALDENGGRAPMNIQRDTDQPLAPQMQQQTDEAQAAEADEVAQLPEHLRRTVVPYAGKERPGTIIIDTPNTYLYLVMEGGRAMRYGIGVGRDGFTWSGVETIARKAEWPDWYPPASMIERQPYLPRFTAGGPGNPLGARAMYLGNTEYRIHGTNNPDTIGKNVSSGCIRLTNDDVIDLYSRVNVGAKVVVMPATRQAAAPQTQKRIRQASTAGGTPVARGPMQIDIRAE